MAIDQYGRKLSSGSKSKSFQKIGKKVFGAKNFYKMISGGRKKK